MALKGLSGQLNLFDFLKDIEQPEGEVQMVSLMPGEEAVEDEPDEPDEPETEEAAETEPDEPEAEETVETEPDAPVMHKDFFDADGKVIAEISYLDYNKVYIRRYGENGETISFDDSKTAVDFYIGEMLKLANLSG